MREKQSTPENQEYSNEIENQKLALCRMEDLFFVSGVSRDSDGSLSMEQSLRLADWAMDNDLGEALLSNGYYPEEFNEADIKRYTLGLLTPAFIYQQHAQDQDSSASLARSLACYNEALREAIKTNPGLQDKELLSLSLHNTVVWADLPGRFPARSSKYIEWAISGASGELITEQLIQTTAMRNAGIAYREASIDDDMRGIDCFVDAPLNLSNDMTLTIHMPVNVKNNFEHIRKLFRSYEEIKTYKVENGKVYFWPGVKKTDLNGKLLLDPAAAEEIGKILVPTILEAADAYDAHHQRFLAKMGHLAVAV